MTTRNFYPRQDINDVADDLAVGVQELRKFGFRLVREPIPGDDGQEIQRDALLASCSLLGLEASADNLRLVSVTNLANALMRNASVASPNT